MQSGSGNRLSINSGRKLNLFTNKEIRIMKKKILSATFVVAMAAIAGYSTYVNQTKVEMSDMALANIEALAQDEGLDVSPGNVLVHCDKSDPSINCFYICTGCLRSWHPIGYAYGMSLKAKGKCLCGKVFS